MDLQNGPIVRERAFRPAWQQGDHEDVYAHQSSAVPVDTPFVVNVPRGVNAILVQALTQNIRYTLAGTPSATSGFRLVAGNDPIAIPIRGGTTLTFYAEVAGAQLEMQFGDM